MEIFKKNKSQYWWFDFTARGRRYRGSTKETNRNRATKIAALRFAEVCEHQDPLPKKAPTLQKVSVRFLAWSESSRLSAKTKTYYQDGWRLLSTTSILGLRLDEVSSDIAERLRFSGAAANANCALRTLRRLLHKAEEWKLIRRAPKITLLAEAGRSLRLDEQTEQKILVGASQCNWRPRGMALFHDLLVLMRDTGMRNEKELYRIRIENINWDRKTIFVPDSKTPNGIREVPMSDRVVAVLESRCGLKKEGWLFPSMRSATGHLTTMASKFREARRKACLPEKLVLYCGRHDFGTRILKETGNLKLVMESMGHIDFKTALKYQHPELEIVRAALNQTNSSGNASVLAKNANGTLCGTPEKPQLGK